MAEMPRDASCLSVVSFSSTIPRAQSCNICYFGFRFACACSSVLFCCLRRSVEPLCHKQDSLMCGAAAFVDSGRRTTHKCCDLYSTVEMLTTRNGPAAIDAAKARYWSNIAIVFAPVGMVWLYPVWKHFEDMVTRFDATYWCIQRIRRYAIFSCSF